jgi:hypothetical protein
VERGAGREGVEGMTAKMRGDVLTESSPKKGEEVKTVRGVTDGMEGKARMGVMVRGYSVYVRGKKRERVVEEERLEGERGPPLPLR